MLRPLYRTTIPVRKWSGVFGVVALEMSQRIIIKSHGSFIPIIGSVKKFARAAFIGVSVRRQKSLLREISCLV